MGFLDRLLGRPQQRPPAPTWPPASAPSSAGRAPGGRPGDDADERAVARYRYLLRTAPPETIEQAHAEAFAQLTPDQRRQVLTDLARDLPAAERSSYDDPRSLARMATRAELRQPGTLERAFGGSRMGGGMGGGMGGMGGFGGIGGGGGGEGGMDAGAPAATTTTTTTTTLTTTVTPTTRATPATARSRPPATSAASAPTTAAARAT